MYSHDGKIVISGISSMNPNLARQHIDFSDSENIKFCLDAKDVIRLYECIKHECKKNNIDYDTYEGEIFGD